MTNHISTLTSFEEQLNQMKRDYVLSLDDKITKIESSFVTINKSESPEETIEDLYRDVHSLKGSSGTFDLPIISTICHQLEDHMKEFNVDKIDTYLKFIDLIRNAVTEVLESDSPSFSQIEKELYDLQKTLSNDQLLVAIIDPSKSNANMVEKIISDHPVKCAYLEDGLVALSYLLFNKYDLIIIAKEVPSISGPGLIAALQATNCANRKTPCIILSSNKYIPEALNESIIYPVQRNSELIPTLKNTIDEIFPNP